MILGADVHRRARGRFIPDPLMNVFDGDPGAEILDERAGIGDAYHQILGIIGLSCSLRLVFGGHFDLIHGERGERKAECSDLSE